MTAAGRPRVVVVGLGPAGTDLLPPGAVAAMIGAASCLVRTERHPAALAAMAAVTAGGGVVEPLDALYEAADDFDGVYEAIVGRVAAEALVAHDRGDDGYACYAVPGSPLVAERSVDMLRRRTDLQVEIVPAVSFLDLAWSRLGVDPVDCGVRLIDAAAFVVDGAGQPGPFLVAQCHHRDLLSEVKLAVGEWADQVGSTPPPAVLLHHLGLADEQVLRVPWADLDRTIAPDHLTTLWVPQWGRSVSSESARLQELVRVLRERCPWDRRQTHASLALHLIEEAYEAVDAIDALAAAVAEEPGRAAQDGPAERFAPAEEPGQPATGEAPVPTVATRGAEVRPAGAEHLLEELGDVAFQVYFHAQLAAESGWFTVADVLRAVHDKLVHRHPHVFGDAVAETAQDVADRWEVLKQREKGRASVFDGIPVALPALAAAAKVQRRAASIGVEPHPSGEDAAGLVAGLVAGGPAIDPADEIVGRTLFALVDLARRRGVDPETALRGATAEFRLRADQAR